MNINNETISEFREDFQKLNHAIELKYGVVLSLGSIKYNSLSFSGTLTVSNNDRGIDDPMQVEFNALCGRYGFTEADYMADVTVDGYGPNVYKLVGFRPKNRKYPIIGLLAGQKFKLPLNARKV